MSYLKGTNHSLSVGTWGRMRGQGDRTKSYSGPAQAAWRKLTLVLLEGHREKLEPWEFCERQAQWLNVLPRGSGLPGGPR